MCCLNVMYSMLETHLNIWNFVSKFSIFNTLHGKCHLWAIIEKHGCCSCIVFSSPFSLSLSQNRNPFQSSFAFKSFGLTRKGTVLPHTSSGKSENQKDSECHLTMQWGENSFCHCCHSEWDYSGDPRPILPLDLTCIQSLLGLCGCIMNALLSTLSAQFVWCLESTLLLADCLQLMGMWCRLSVEGVENVSTGVCEQWESIINRFQFVYHHHENRMGRRVFLVFWY